MAKTIERETEDMAVHNCEKLDGNVIHRDDRVLCEVDGVVFDVTETGIPVFDSAIREPENRYKKHTAEFRALSPEELMELQYRIFETGYYERVSPHIPGEKKFWRSVVRSNVEHLKEEMREGEAFKSFVVEKDEEGELTDYQEGRHRLVALQELDVDKVPVFIARKKRP